MAAASIRNYWNSRGSCWPNGYGMAGIPLSGISDSLRLYGRYFSALSLHSGRLEMAGLSDCEDTQSNWKLQSVDYPDISHCKQMLANEKSIERNRCFYSAYGSDDIFIYHTISCNWLCCFELFQKIEI